MESDRLSLGLRPTFIYITLWGLINRKRYKKFSKQQRKCKICSRYRTLIYCFYVFYMNFRKRKKNVAEDMI